MANFTTTDHSEKRLSLVYDTATDSYKVFDIDDITSKGSIISNFTLSGSNGTALQANANREELFVQNLATGNLYVKYGANAANDSFNFVLAGNTSVNAGDGGSLSDLNYTGIVSVSGAVSPNYIIWERS